MTVVNSIYRDKDMYNSDLTLMAVVNSIYRDEDMYSSD